MSRRAFRALPPLAVVLLTALWVGAATFTAAAAVQRVAPPPKAEAVVLTPAVPAAPPLCAVATAHAEDSELILPPLKKRCDTGKACTVPQDCQCMGYPCACVDNKCVCAYP